MVSQSRDLFENHFASSVGVGAVAAHLYAKRLAELPLVLLAQAVTTVSFSHMSQLAARNDRQGVLEITSSCVRSLGLILLPLGATTFLLSEQIVTLVFQRGAFDLAATASSASALRIYGVALPLLAIEPVVIAAFFALKDTRTPVAAGILAAAIELTLMALLVDTWGLQGMAGALVVSKLVKVVSLGAILRRWKLGSTWSALVSHTVRLLVPFVACLAVGAAIVERAAPSARVAKLQLAAQTTGSAIAIVVVYFLVWILIGPLSRLKPIPQTQS
jgi:putative peptidoglycan lipid II flippase